MPAAAVQPVRRWRRELVAEFGWLPGDQRTVAAAGAADVDDGLVQLACHAVPGLGERVTVEAQPDYYVEILSLLQFSPLRAGSCPQAGQARGGPCSGGRLVDAGMARVRQRGQQSRGCGRQGVLRVHSPCVPGVTLGELRLLACPANERLRHAHPGAGMLTMSAPSGSVGTPAAVTDGGGGANMRRASSRRSGADPIGLTRRPP